MSKCMCVRVCVFVRVCGPLVVYGVVVVFGGGGGVFVSVVVWSLLFEVGQINNFNNLNTSSASSSSRSLSFRLGRRLRPWRRRSHFSSLKINFKISKTHVVEALITA